MSLSAELKLLCKSKLSESVEYAKTLENILNHLVGINEISGELQIQFGTELSHILNDSRIDWEVCNYCIKVLTKLCGLLRNECVEEYVAPILKTLLEHQEPRVRTQASSIISYVVDSYSSGDASENFLRYLLDKLISNMERTESTRPAALGDVTDIALDDTTGWNNLESYLLAVHSAIIVQSRSSREATRDTLVSLQIACKGTTVCLPEFLLNEFYLHQNRHIREMTLVFISQYLSGWANRTADTSDSLHYRSLHSDPRYATLFNLFANAVDAGMKDNWSQIRLKAVQACHSVLLCLVANAPEGNVLSPMLSGYWSQLLPGLCLNRYYTADAVQNAALAAWREVIATHGKTLISSYSTEVVLYYIEASGSSNHMVAEAACISLGEFISRLDRDTVLPQLDKISDALTLCLKDERWPVKDQACVPTGMLVRHFPIETRHMWSEFVRLWNGHLKDCIWSVRENAALAYASAIQCSEAEEYFLGSIQTYLTENLLAALNDTVSSVKPSLKNFSFLPPSMLAPKPSVDASNKRVVMEDDKIASLVTESLVPPVAKKSWGCCVDCVELRQSQPWEVTQGALYLMREVAKTHPAMIVDKRFTKLVNNSLSPVEGVADSVVTLLDCLSVLLLTDNVVNADKLHNAVYDEVSLICCCFISSYCF